MTNPELRFEEMIARLKERDYRLTPQRLALVRLIASGAGHPSAMQLHEQIKAQFPTMSLATVYKTLDLLKELGQVIEIALHDDNHYDGSFPYPHPHLICTRCRKIIDGELEPAIQKLIEAVQQESGFRIERHQLNFYGLCPECQNVNHH